MFVSTLFYLLSWSDEQYLPVMWIMDLLPHLTAPSSAGGEDQITKEQGEAFQRAIRCVLVGGGASAHPRDPEKHSLATRFRLTLCTKVCVTDEGVC